MTGDTRHVCDYPQCSERGSGHPLACGCRSASALPEFTRQALDRAVHMAHCNQGEWVGSCKYGEDLDCPALGEPRIHLAEDWRRLDPPRPLSPWDAGMLILASLLVGADLAVFFREGGASYAVEAVAVLALVVVKASCIVFGSRSGVSAD